MLLVRAAGMCGVSLLVACSCVATQQGSARDGRVASVRGSAKSPRATRWTPPGQKDRLPGIYYVKGSRPYLLVIVQYDQDIHKDLRIPQGRAHIETAEVLPPSDAPEITSHPVSWHHLTIDSPRHLPVLLRIDMGTIEENLDDYTSVNDSRTHFTYGHSKFQYYATIWLSGGHNVFKWVRNEGA